MSRIGDSIREVAQQVAIAAMSVDACEAATVSGILISLIALAKERGIKCEELVTGMRVFWDVDKAKLEAGEVN